jgi:3-oxoacyl-[acyl-carrier-protein] synthase II
MARFSPEPVAVTGIGMICPLGTTREQAWTGVVEGRSGLREIRGLDVSSLSFRLAGEIDGIDAMHCAPPFDQPWVDRASLLAVVAAEEALSQAAMVPDTCDPYRIGVVLGRCQYRTGLIQDYFAVVDRDGYAAAHPGPMVNCRMSAPADAVALRYGLRGPKYTVSNACAAGGSAIGIALDVLRWQRADAMLAGGVDLLELYAMAGFDGLHAVDPRGCAPYSRSGGITIGEGAAVMVLEPAARARARGATVLAYVAGYGLSSDAYHATSPDPGGAGAVRSTMAALRQAGLGVEDIDYVNGHGTGTQANDTAERAAMRSLFGSRAGRVPISSTKSQIGHTMGAAGAIEAAVSVQAIQQQVLPPTINVDDEARSTLDLDIVPDNARPAAVRAVLSNSFAFGGANCTLALTAEPGRARGASGDRRVVVTGVGLISSVGATTSFREAMRTGSRGVRPIQGFAVEQFGCRLAGEIDDRSHLRWIDPAYARRLDQIGRIATAAARMCFDDAKLRLRAAERDRAGAIFATHAGPVETTMCALRSAMASAGGKVNPRIFPNTVMNAAAGHVCVALQLKGPTTTLVGGFVAGLQGIAYAADLIRQGEADVMLAVSADELSMEVHGLYDSLGLLTGSCPRPYDVAGSGMVLSAGACVLTLESLEGAQRRGAPILGEVLGHAVTADARLVGSVDPDGAAWAQSLRLAIDDAGIDASDVACVFGEGRASNTVDRSELRALNAVFDDAPTRVATLSAQLGHAQATQGPLGVVAALSSVATGCVPEIAGLEQPLAEMGDLRWHGPVTPGRPVMVTVAAAGGTYASLLVGPAPV